MTFSPPQGARNVESHHLQLQAVVVTGWRVTVQSVGWWAFLQETTRDSKYILIVNFLYKAYSVLQAP